MAGNSAVARERMVDNQVRTADVIQFELLDAFMEVPRERFVPEERRPLAYTDCDIQIGPGRSMMTPASLARLLQAARIQPGDSVLDIGCGTGYSAAIISRVCASVVAVEEHHDLIEAASKTLSELEYDNAVVVEGKLSEGYASEGPFDVIFLGGSIDVLPDTILGQLGNGGRLVAVVGHGNAAMAKLWFNDDGHMSIRPMFNCSVPSLPGFSRKAEFTF